MNRSETPLLTIFVKNTLFMQCRRLITLCTCIYIFLCPIKLNAQCGPGACKVCEVTATITAIEGGVIDNGTVTISGNIDAGDSGTANDELEVTANACGEITVTVVLDFIWDQGVNINWIHGISFFNSAGWFAAEGTIIPADPGWIFLDDITGLCSGNMYGAGYYWDPVGTTCGDSGNLSSYDGTECVNNFDANGCEDDDGFLTDGDPSDNWGIDCAFFCPQFGFELTYCPSASGTVLEEISFFLTEDGETGGWTQTDGCVFELIFPITINSAGVQLPEFEETVCIGECFTLDAGEGCDNYDWSNGESGQMIEVCPTETTTYGVTATSPEGCMVDGEATILVEFCCEADAGELSSDSPACPNETINFSVINYNAEAEYTQVLLVVDENGLVVEVLAGDTGSFTHDMCATFTIYSYNYLTSGDSPVPFIGMDISTIDCVAECCDLVSLEVEFTDTEVPTFPNPPGDLSLICIDDLLPMIDQTWEDNCDGTGTVAGVEDGSMELCAGGTITRTWTYTDICGNTGEHIQTITLDPPLEAVINNPPSDETVTCEMVPGSFSDLTYTNSMDGACEISGNLSPMVVEDYTNCGGSIMLTWMDTDVCDREISHNITITVEPAPEASFTNPPADMSVSCMDQMVNFDPLAYTNGGTNCLISGTVDPVIIEDFDPICGGDITATWEYTDECDRTINHTQIITIEPAPEASFINPPADMTIDCYDGMSFTADPLDYTNSTIGCLIEGSVDPDIVENITDCQGDITITWEFTDPCNRSITHTQTITVVPPAEASFTNPPMDMSIDCYDNMGYMADPLDYSNNDMACLIEGTAIPVVVENITDCQGDITITWEAIDECNRTISHTQVITVNPPTEAIFINPPANTTINCYDDMGYVADPLDYSNSDIACLIEGSAMPVVVENITDCQGDITITWEATDECNRTINHTQVITVNPPTEANFVNPPTDMVLPCSSQDVIPVDLMYTNSDMACLIEGTTMPVVINNANECGGDISISWETVDACNRTISHSQTISISPSAEPVFLNLPADMTINCDAPIPSFEPLDYSNSDMAPCLIMGNVVPDIVDNLSPCGGDISATWEYTDPCDRTISHTQTITIDPVPEATFINPPGDLTVACVNIPAMPTDLAYNNNYPACPIEGTVSPTVIEDYDICGGSISYTWVFTDDCDRTISHTQIYTIEPAPMAGFINLPMDMTMSCNDFDGFSPVDLSYTNNLMGACAIEGAVPGSFDADLNECGVVVPVIFEFTDACGRMITHTQTITVEPAPIAAFTSLPMNMTVDCIDINIDPPSLDYTNNGSGNCLISGSVNPIQAGDSDACGGPVSYIWTFTDACNRTISHTQVITYLPAAEPEFLNPPEDGFLDCDGELPNDLSLEYDNFENFPCVIAGAVEPTIEQVGNIITLTWNYTNDCSGNTISYVQTYEQSIPVDWEEDAFEITICDDDLFDLSTLIPIDLNNTNPTVSYYDGFPFTASNELASSVVSPFFPSIFYIVGNNIYDCPDYVEVFIDLDDLDIAGSDTESEICIDEGVMDLYDYISNEADFSGDFIQVSGESLNISDPESVNISNVPAGTYVFEYIIEPTDYCPGSSAFLTVELLAPIVIEVTAIYCSPDFQTYVVEVTNNGYDLDFNEGEFFEIGFNSAIIGNIPIGEVLEIEAASLINDCVGFLQVSPPNCDCPDVEAPTSDGDKIICFGDPIPSLTVTPAPGTTTNWYDAPVGGNLLTSDTDSYTPSVSNPGIYTFYVEGESLTDVGCVSDVRIEISLEILAGPNYTDLGFELCDADTDGIMTFDSLDLQSFINISLTQTIAYYPSLEDAENNTNEINMPYSNLSPFNDIIFAEISNASGCTKIIMVSISVRPKPELELTAQDESCANFDDGIASIVDFDPMNTYLFEGDVITEEAVDSLSPGLFDFIIIDPFGCTDTTSIEIFEGLTMSLDAFSWTCNDNGTNTDPSDDYYEISFMLSNNQGNSGSYEVLDELATSFGVFNYGETGSFTIPADDSSPIFDFIDQDFACLLSQSIGPLGACSTNCVISLDSLESACNDNGTPSDPSDDYYEISLIVSAINGSSIDRYNVAINGVITFSFVYGEPSNFTLPANGSIVTLGLTDAEDLACTINEAVGPLDHCSNECAISVIVSNVYCDNNGTEDINEDDVYYFTINVSGVNTAAGFNIASIGFNGSYDTDYELGPFNIIDGSWMIEIADDDDPDCTTSLNITPPIACSDACSIVADVTDVLCNNNGTETDNDDDVFYFNLLANGANVSGSFNIPELAFNGVYNTTYNLGPFDIISGNFTITLIDDGDPDCSLMILIQAPPACSDLCTISTDISEVICNDNGTDDFSDDDTYSFVLLATGINTSTSFTIAELAFAGEYGIAYSFGPYDITDGDLSFSIVDDADAECWQLIDVLAPPSCSDCTQTIILSNPETLSCDIPTTVITVTPSEPGSYLWQGPDGFGSLSQSISVGVPGIYSVTVTFDNDCTETASVEVFADEDIPVALLGPDQLLTCIVDEVMLDASNSTYPDGSIFEWTDSNGNLISNELNIIVNTAGSYYFIIIDPATGCNSTQQEIQVIVDTDEPSVVIFADPGNVLDCFVESINITTAEEADVLYSWFVDGYEIGASTIQISEPAIIGLLAIDTITGCENSAELTVLDLTEYPIVIFEEVGDLDCESGEICIDAASSPFADDLQFLWYDNNGNIIQTGGQQLCVTSGGNYELELTDPANGCINSEVITVDAAIVPSVSLPGIININSGNPTEISVDINIPLDQVAEIIWSPAEVLSCNDCVNNTIIDPSDGLVITVEVISITDCVARASTILNEDIVIEINVPNIFNPNSNSGNHEFTLYGNEHVEIIENMYVYDRWGELVYHAENIEPNNPSLGWDGTFKGRPAEEGVYVYLFEVLISSGETEKIAGDVTLIY